MEDKAPRKVFSDDMAVTSKYWETVIQQGYSQPEKELMLAVLKDAVLDTYKKCMYSGNALFKRLRLGYLTGNTIGFMPLKRFALCWGSVRRKFGKACWFGN